MSGISGMCSAPAPEIRNCATYSCAVVGEDVPAVLVVVPVGAVDQRAEPDVAAQPVLLGDALEVVEDLRLEGPHVRPVGLAARRRTSTGATGCRRRSPGSCCRARCRRCRRPSPGCTKSTPWRCSAMAMPRPENPVPMMSAGVDGVLRTVASSACVGNGHGRSSSWRYAGTVRQYLADGVPGVNVPDARAGQASGVRGGERRRASAGRGRS